ncbi:MAG: type I-E CRISPR-associated endoribonuclease Cas2e [Chloroflexota bacterium]
MIVMILERVPLRLRGELTRWLIEPRSGIFVGHVNGMVRERLWEKCCKARGTGGIVQLWSTNTEQHFKMRMEGDTTRRIVEVEGLQLIQIPLEPEEKVDEDEIEPPNMEEKP